jgi:hypothetical protein
MADGAGDFFDEGGEFESGGIDGVKEVRKGEGSGRADEGAAGEVHFS